MITKIGVALSVTILLASPCLAQDRASQKFLKEAIEGNFAEVQMGQLAQKQGNSDGVRSFGQMLEKDHSDANKKAVDVANSLGMTPPTEPSKKQKADYDKMSKMSGTQFDKAFATHMWLITRRTSKSTSGLRSLRTRLALMPPKRCPCCAST